MATDVLGTRTVVHAYAEAYSVTAAEVMVPLAVQRTGAALVAASGTALVVPAGKTLRISSLEASITLLGTTVSTTRLRLRAVTTGAVALTSPIQGHTVRIGGSTALANHVYQAGWKFPEGLEFPAGSNISITAIATTAAMHSLDLSLIGFEYTP